MSNANSFHVRSVHQNDFFSFCLFSNKNGVYIFQLLLQDCYKLKIHDRQTGAVRGLRSGKKKKKKKKKTIHIIHITKTCPCNVYPLELHFYMVKLGFAGVYIIFLLLIQNIYCGYSLEPPRRGGSNVYPQCMF